MKLCVLTNCLLSLGAWNYIYFLLSHLKKSFNSFEITLFHLDDPILHFVDFLSELENIGIKTVSVPTPSGKLYHRCSTIISILNGKLNNHFFRKVIFKVASLYVSRKNRETSSLFNKSINGFDVVFYPWPYSGEVIKTKSPAFFVPHDFIYTHWFGLHSGNDSYSDYKFKLFRSVHFEYLKFATPIVSSNYIANELKKTFPDYKKNIDIIHLPSFNNFEILSKKEISSYLISNGIHHDYILWPSNWMYHKNLSVLIGAFYEIKKQFHNLKIILTGIGTDGIKATCNSPFYCDHLKNDFDDWDIVGLGTLSPRDFSKILQGAKIVINTSLCEAGSGSSLDAWNVGVPVAISDIEPFREQAEFLKTHAVFFDPRNSHDVAEKVINILNNYDYYLKRAQESKINISKYNWDEVAKKYGELFLQAFDKKNKI